MKTLITILCILLAAPAFAEGVNYRAMEQGGFGDVAKLLKEMTPEQREAVMKQAKLQEKELEKLTPAEQESLRKQLRATANTINMQGVDPAKLDVAKTKSADDIRKDLGTYEEKRAHGELKNDVMKPAAAGQ